MLWLLPVVVVLALGGVALFRARPAAEISRPAPLFELPDLAHPESRIALNDFRGKLLVMNFWASWCDPCREEAPELARVARKHAGRVNFLGVNILDGRDEALKYVDQYGIDYPSVRDSRAITAKRYGVSGAPETIFIDKRGYMVGKYIGAFREDQLERLVRDLIALKPGGALQITGRGETRPVP
jgi:cytochrome c biogenesis protein CcmG/thiol:disulfide interchange protein DsbE